MTLLRTALPQFNNLEIVQKNVGGGHRYFVEGFPCGTCYMCNPKPRKNGTIRKAGKCIGLPSVTSFSGQWGGGGLYPAGYRHALDAVFGEYTDKAKDAVKDGGWMSDYVKTARAELKILASIGEPTDGVLDVIKSYRQEVEEIPTPGNVARDFGTGVHKSLEQVLRGDEEAEIPAVYANAVSAVLTWLEKGGSDGPYVVEATEVNVFHPELLIGGQVDCIARIGNRVIIIDWKSGKEIYPNHAIQIAAYAMCYEAMTGEQVAEAWVVKASPITGFEAKRVEDLIPAQNAFIALQEVKRNVDLINFV